MGREDRRKKELKRVKEERAKVREVKAGGRVR